MRIDSAQLKNGERLNFGDFNVFIGGNGVGKTTALIELFYKICAINRNKYFWIDSVAHSTMDLSNDIVLLKGSLGRKYEGLSAFYYSNAVKGIDGNIENLDNIRFSSDEFKKMLEINDPNTFNDTKYRRPFVSFSSCESRLNLNNEVALTSLDLPPQDSVNVLHRNKPLLENVSKKIFDIFKRRFILLSHSETKLHIGISKEEAPVFNSNALVLQDEYEKVEVWKTQKFIPITEAGHGIRSMIKLLTSLLEPVNQVILVDEPEMHIYPSQKRWLGRQLVSLAKEQHKQVFLVTHDPMILQGILDVSTTTRIFRVDRDEADLGLIKTCDLDRIADASALRNQEQYLQGLFYQRCVVVEGASDRSFYQNMFEKYPETSDKDLGVVVAGGDGSSKHVAHIVSKVGLKAVFIYDLDTLLDKPSLVKDIYYKLGGANDPVEKFVAIFNADSTVSASRDDAERRINLRVVTGYTGKTGLSESWKNTHRVILDEIFSALADKGIFFVTNGTLESWAPDVEPKFRFAELAPEVVKNNELLKANFDKFAKNILAYLDISLSI